MLRACMLMPWAVCCPAPTASPPSLRPASLLAYATSSRPCKRTAGGTVANLTPTECRLTRTSWWVPSSHLVAGPNRLPGCPRPAQSTQLLAGSTTPIKFLLPVEMPHPPDKRLSRPRCSRGQARLLGSFANHIALCRPAPSAELALAHASGQMAWPVQLLLVLLPVV
jgi:hypothetical protein